MLPLIILTVLIPLAVIYYLIYIPEQPRVYANSGKLQNFLNKHVQILKRKFYPSPLIFEGRLQTIFSLSLRKTNPDELPYSREILKLSDGGEVALDFMGSEKSKFLILFLPGLTSCSQSSYVRTLVQTLNKSGASVLVFNNRGNGGVAFKTPKTYSGSYIGDLKEVISHVKKKYAGYRLIGLGTSMGGMVLSKYLHSCPVEARESFECAVLISVVWDCIRGSENLEKPFINKYLINRELTNGLITLGKKLIALFGEVPGIDKKKAFSAKTVKEFDAAWTSRQFGFKSVLDYYKDATTNGNVHKYSIPVFGLSAEDDPIQPGHLLPVKEAEEEGSKLAMVVTKRGGHIGWLEGVGRGPHYMEKVVGELVEAIRIFGEELS